MENVSRATPKTLSLYHEETTLAWQNLVLLIFLMCNNIFPVFDQYQLFFVSPAFQKCTSITDTR